MSEPITLNVGGTKYTTTLSTLTSVEDTMLERMFTGSLKPKPASDGSYFIDSDGDIFEYVLEYLHCRKISIDDLDKNTILRINRALDYFSINYQLDYQLYLRHKYPLPDIPIWEKDKLYHYKNTILLKIHKDFYSFVIKTPIKSSDDSTSIRKSASGIYFKYRIRILSYEENRDNVGYSIRVQTDFNDPIILYGAIDESFFDKINGLFLEYWD